MSSHTLQISAFNYMGYLFHCLCLTLEEQLGEIFSLQLEIDWIVFNPKGEGNIIVLELPNNMQTYESRQ